MRAPAILGLAVSLLGGAVSPGSGHAQQAMPLPAPARVDVDTLGVDASLRFHDGHTPSASDSDSAAAPVWEPVTADPWRALGEVTLANVFAVGINVLWRDEPSTHPGSWWDNLNGGWEWDTNPIRVNSFEHPWAGATYFNIGRANGLSFDASLPAAAIGSLMWELFGEPRPPSANDLVATTLGGATLGEPLYRLSLIVLDNEAAGLDRFWREATVFIFNPGLGLSRLSRGQSWRFGANPPMHRPALLRGDLGMGAIRLAPAEGLPGPDADAALLRFSLDYGDPFDGRKIRPFSTFNGILEMTSLNAVLTRLGVRGLATEFSEDGASKNRIVGLFIDFDYRWDGRVGIGTQGVGLGMLSRLGSERWRVLTDVSAEAVPLLASTDRWAHPVVDRDYEFGSGLGGRAAAQLQHEGDRILSGDLRAYWSVTLNGASTSKIIQMAEVEARTPRLGPLALGMSYRLYRQSSTYDDRPTGHASMSSVSLFLTSGF